MMHAARSCCDARRRAARCPSEISTAWREGCRHECDATRAGPTGSGASHRGPRRSRGHSGTRCRRGGRGRQPWRLSHARTARGTNGRVPSAAKRRLGRADGEEGDVAASSVEPTMGAGSPSLRAHSRTRRSAPAAASDAEAACSACLLPGWVALSLTCGRRSRQGGWQGSGGGARWRGAGICRSPQSRWTYV